ncbi:uncharacterized protein LOC144439645 [Glandiceps talaboti]
MGLFSMKVIILVIFVYKIADTNAAKTWRDDRRCGIKYLLPSAEPAECNPEGKFPCCSPADFCGKTADHCKCFGCLDYREPKKWRDDFHCGKKYRLPNGKAAECNPRGEYPCCSNNDWCGKTLAHCGCKGCIDYRGPEMWRDDLRCGKKYRLPDGRPAQCNPRGKFPCCSADGWCGDKTPEHCDCKKCVNYKV